MLKLIDVKKDYYVGDQTIHALKGISLNFRKNEFVAILGQSGCGKTTLMNIIGGLDRMTDGDILINNESTKNFQDRDWDDYRNTKIGFVFQSYNLIPHISVLDNVELSLTISGIGREERLQRSKQALEMVGLANEIHKRPNQLSGGQMQRVAIARAIVNEPEILLADEPTGAVDSETSIQLMDILQEIAKTRLVIMVTHNEELANTYATRIVKVLDGLMVSDSNPYEEKPVEMSAESTPKKKSRRKKASTMSFFTSAKLAWKNIITKRGRSILTSIAGAIGIIAISLILSLNNGFSQYIEEFESQSMSKYPITVSSGSDSLIGTFRDFLGGDELNGDSLNYSAVLDLFTDQDTDRTKYTKEQKMFIYNQFSKMFEEMLNSVRKTNDISKFKKYFEENFDTSLGTYKYDYSINMNIYNYDAEDETYDLINPISESDTFSGVLEMLQDENTTEDDYDGISSLLDKFNFWDEMINMNVIANQYDILAGALPTNMNEIVLVLDEYNQITDFDLLLLNEIAVVDMLSAMGDEHYFDDYEKNFDSIIGQEFYILPTSKAYVYNEMTHRYDNLKKSTQDKLKEAIINGAITVKISGIIRAKEGTKGSINGIVGYTSELGTTIIKDANDSAYVKAQIAEYNLYSEAMTKLMNIVMKLPDGFDYKTATEEQLQEYLTDEEIETLNYYKSPMHMADLILSDVTNNQTIDESKYNTILSRANYRDLDKPSYIYIYPSSVGNKAKISSFIEDFNSNQAAEEERIDKEREDAGEDPTDVTYVITYSDDLDSAVTELTTLSNTITYILIAVALVSVIVTMILIAIVMYISVQDRTREIGIMRSLGARKLDISNVFNVETLILGLASGLIGVLLGFILTYPANAILNVTIGIDSMMRMAIWHPFVLIAGAIIITVISGLIPSVIAAKKDPVIALRTE